MLEPAVIDDTGWLLAGPDPAALADLRLGRYVTLAVATPSTDGRLRITRTLATMLSEHADAVLAPTNDSGDALRVLAQAYIARSGKRLPTGAVFALRLVTR